MKKYLWLIFAWALPAHAGPIPGVPNDLRRMFKSIHQQDEEPFELLGQQIKARRLRGDPRPVLLYDIPPHVPLDDLRSWVAKEYLNQNFALQWRKSDGLWQGHLSYQGRLVEQAHVKLSQDTATAIAIDLPRKNLTPILFASPQPKDHLTLAEGIFTAFRQSDGRIEFPKSTKLPTRQIKLLTAKPNKNGKLTKFALPKGSFPDQIVADGNGTIWFTQPRDNLLTGFRADSLSWTHHKVGRMPDGLTIDRHGRLWVGLYQDGDLANFNPATEEYQEYPIPEAESWPAIPFEAKDESIWVSDHQANRIYRYNQQEFTHYDMISSNAWPVDFAETSAGLYVTLCFANRLGIVDQGQLREMKLGVNSCPAFVVQHQENLYVSLWKQYSFLKIDPKGKITEFRIRHNPKQAKSQGFGPIAVDADGMLYLGALGTGRVYRFNPNSQAIDWIEGVGKLKDGMTIDAEGRVWVSEVDRYLTRLQF